MITLFVIFLILAALVGTPLFVILAAMALLLFLESGTATVVLSEEHYKLATNPHLITIPLFTFAGFVMAHSKAADRLVAVSRALLGWLPGGLAIVVIATCAFFTTFTGASGVTIIALGGLFLPMMIQEKYPEEFSLGIITSSGSLDFFFHPPCISFACRFDDGYFQRNCGYCTFNNSNRSKVRRRSRASRNYISCEYGTWIPYAARRYELIYKLPSIR